MNTSKLFLTAAAILALPVCVRAEAPADSSLEKETTDVPATPAATALDGRIEPAPFSADENQGLFNLQPKGADPSDFFAPSSGTFPGVIDTLGFGSSGREQSPPPDESDFSD